MNLLCLLFGHTPARPACGGPQYGEVWGSTWDGLGTQHLFLKYRCRRCPEPIYLNLHAPEKND